MSVGSAWYRDLDQLEDELRQVVGSPEIDGYTILRCLHRGGQGVVFAARDDAKGGRVAIKMPRDGSLTTVRARRRFERELELLGQVDHPGIVKILGHDRTIDGEPYLVMELVEGEPIDRVIDRARGDVLTAVVRNRIVRLAIEMCNAMRHAHRRGIIHRDLKPSNVLVDESGAIRIVDFGLARDITGESGLTGSDDGIMGSIAWMSPEHVCGSSASIDARSDIYAIGLILHRLLSGRMPYDAGGSIAQTLRNIERSPPASCGSIEHVGEDLGEVVLRCLQKDPNERYQTVEDLERDLRSVRDGVPIEVRRTRAWARSMRALKRYRVGATVGVVVLVGVATVALLMSVLWRRASDAEKLASERADAAQLASARAEIATGVLEGLLANLDSGATVDASLLSRLERAAEVAGSDTDPALRARLAVALGRVYLMLGSFEAAAARFGDGAAMAGEAFGESHGEVALALLGQGEALAHLANPRAIADHGSSLRLRRRVFNPKAPTLSVVLGTAGYARWAGGTGGELWAQAEASTQRALELLELAGREVDLAVGRVTLAKLRMWQGRPREALTIFGQARAAFEELGQVEHPAHVEAIRYSAHLLSNLGRLEEAERDCREALLLAPRVHGPWVRPELLWELAWIRHREGFADEAVELFYRSLGEVCRLAGSERADLRNLGTLGEQIGPQGPSDLERLVKELGAAEMYSPDGVSWYRFGVALIDADRPEAAEVVLRRAVDDINAQLSPRNAWSGRARGALGLALTSKGQVDEGLALGRASYEHACGVTGVGSPCRRLALTRLGRQFEIAGQSDQARRVRAALAGKGPLPALFEILAETER